MLGRLVWERLVTWRRGHGDLAVLGGVDHLAHHLFCQYCQWGAPVMLAGMEWTEEDRWWELDRGPRQSTMAHVPFIQ